MESGDALLMVRREICRARPPRQGGSGMALGAMDERFTVFEADFRSPRWAEVSAVGDDRALFVGRWCSKAAPVPDDEHREWADVSSSWKTAPATNGKVAALIFERLRR